MKKPKGVKLWTKNEKGKLVEVRVMKWMLALCLCAGMGCMAAPSDGDLVMTFPLVSAS